MDGFFHPEYRLTKKTDHMTAAHRRQTKLTFARVCSSPTMRAILNILNVKQTNIPKTAMKGISSSPLANLITLVFQMIVPPTIKLAA